MTSIEAGRPFLEGTLLRVVLLGGLALAATGVAVWLLAWGSSSAPIPAGPDSVARASFLDQTGVQVVRVAATGGGGLLDLRVRVVDPGAAAIVHKPGTKPALVDERSGAVIDALLMGHSHSGKFKAGQTYYFVFVNGRRHVRPGEQVTVALGGQRLEHVVVE